MKRKIVKVGKSNKRKKNNGINIILRKNIFKNKSIQKLLYINLSNDYFNNQMLYIFKKINYKDKEFKENVLYDSGPKIIDYRSWLNINLFNGMVTPYISNSINDFFLFCNYYLSLRVNFKGLTINIPNEISNSNRLIFYKNYLTKIKNVKNLVIQHLDSKDFQILMNCAPKSIQK